jgi:hypothetical protein
MAEEHKCGPETDPDFFNELKAVFDKYPDTAQKYSIRCIAFEKDRMGVDFEKQIGISRIEGHQIITEFQDIDGGATQAGFPCLEWDWAGLNCIKRHHMET